MADDLRLKVVASSINGQGVAKLDRDTFERLKLNEGTIITITYGAKSIELAAKMDNVFSESTARLMRPDMAALRVDEGMLVTVAKKNSSSHQTPKKPLKKGSKNPNAASLDSF